MAEHSSPIEQARRRTRPETSAWIMLVAFFLVFCALVAAGALAGWRYYNESMVAVRGAEVRVHAPAGVAYQEKGSSELTTPSTPCERKLDDATAVCIKLTEGGRVQAKSEAGYGPVASIVLPDGTRIADMYAHPTGADLTLSQYQVSQWTRQREIMKLAQAAGYVRYDIPATEGQPYAEVTYEVEITKGVSLRLGGGGSYSVDVPRYDQQHPPALAPSGKPLIAEVAVRDAGSAEVHTPGGVAIVRPGQKVQIDADKIASQPLDARWQLIRDGDFPCEKVTNDHCGAWQRIGYMFDPSVTPAEQNAVFSVYRGCRPEKPAFCGKDETVDIAQFYREGNQSKSYGVGISQTLDLDISEYRTLRFSAWARIIKQTIPGAGIANIECPVTVEIWYKQDSPLGDQQKRSICVYMDDRETTSQATQLSGQLAGGFVYQSVPPSTWYQIEFNLRDDSLLPKARYLQVIRVVANGHDYISEVTDVSLLATQ
jgi:hypothetical protein